MGCRDKRTKKIKLPIWVYAILNFILTSVGRGWFPTSFFIIIKKNKKNKKMETQAKKETTNKIKLPIWVYAILLGITFALIVVLGLVK